MFIKLLIASAAILVILLVVAAARPSQFRISRRTTIAAPAASIFALVHDFHRWTAWSPWEAIDPALQRNYAGSAAGPGAVYSWVGNKQVGEGRMTITESRPNELILINLEFFKPFAATNVTEFKFTPEGGQTAVSWTMTGTNNFMFKVMGLVMNMDKMVGDQFVQGLATMKSIA